MDEKDVRRRFDALIAGSEMTDLRTIADAMSVLGADVDAPRPVLRRPPLDGIRVFRIWVELDGAEPAIWRRLDVRSDATLADLHSVLQAAYGWADAHLHRFALGGGPWDATSELFLCPFDVDEGEDDGTAASDVRLDETLQQPGDVLRYAYDYGDGWELILRLEDVASAGPGAPLALCVDGGRAAPPEDSRGLDDDELFALRGDPEAFDVDEVNAALRSPLLALRDAGASERLIDLVSRARGTVIEDDLAAHALGAVGAVSLGDAERDAGLAAIRWFLDRASGDGIRLTQAGYLPPADVAEAAVAVPAMNEWFGGARREADAAPLREFRKMLRTVGLLRVYRGRMLLTRTGAAAQRSNDALWESLARRVRGVIDGEFVAFEGREGEIQADFSRDATTLLLLAAAEVGESGRMPFDRVARWLSALGWSTGEGRPIVGWQLYGEPIVTLLENMVDPAGDVGGLHRIGPVGQAFARAVLGADAGVDGGAE